MDRAVDRTFRRCNKRAIFASEVTYSERGHCDARADIRAMWWNLLIISHSETPEKHACDNAWIFHCTAIQSNADIFQHSFLDASINPLHFVKLFEKM